MFLVFFARSIGLLPFLAYTVIGTGALIIGLLLLLITGAARTFGAYKLASFWGNKFFFTGVCLMSSLTVDGLLPLSSFLGVGKLVVIFWGPILSIH